MITHNILQGRLKPAVHLPRTERRRRAASAAMAHLAMYFDEEALRHFTAEHTLVEGACIFVFEAEGFEDCWLFYNPSKDIWYLTADDTRQEPLGFYIFDYTYNWQTLLLFLRSAAKESE